MKKILLLLIVMIPLTLFAPPSPVPNPDINSDNPDIWNAVCYVESRHNPMAINQPEQAYGIVQIRQIRLDDYYNRTGIRYELTDMFDTVKSREVFDYYAKGTPEQIAKNWNRSKTDKYWELIKKRLLIHNN